MKARQQGQRGAEDGMGFVSGDIKTERCLIHLPRTEVREGIGPCLNPDSAVCWPAVFPLPL